MVTSKQHPYQAFRRISAMLMLLLLCMVLLIKALHAHSYGESRPFLKDPARAAVAAAHHCPVCDYQLSRDAEVAPALLISVYLVAIVIAPVIYSYSYRRFQQKLRPRGPPYAAMLSARLHPH